MPTGTLPASGKKLWESVYKEAKASGDSTEIAARKAWAAVKKSWKKKNGKWVKKSEMLAEASMYITRASLDGKIMRWAAVNSDTDPDSYEERMSLELYQDFIGHINRNESIPEEFKTAICSQYWCGGMPYLSISHYPDLNGQAVPGEPNQVYIDGNKLKAKGVLYNSPLGHSVFRSLQEDKNKSPDEKIRISIGFLDLAHRHGEGGKLWVRQSATSICPECLEGVEGKIYVKGHLVHLALTRVPVNKRTEMILEEKSEMSKKRVTRKEDAESIVGASEADKIEALAKVQTIRSDALVEMSEGEEPTAEETQELVEEAEGSVPEPEQEAVIEESMSKDKEDKPEQECAEDDEDCKKKMKEKSESTPVVEENMDEGYSLPYGGATSMKDAKKARDAMEEMEHVMDLWGMFSSVAWNIIDRGDMADKKAAFVKALDEFKSMLAAKAMVEFSVAEKPTTIEVKAETYEHELQPALDVLLSAIDNSINFEGDVVTKLQTVNPVLQELGTAITDYVTRKSVEANEPPAQNKDNDNLLDKITELIQPLSQSVQELKNQVGILEAKSNVQNIQPKNRIPVPRSAQIKPELVRKAEAIKPGSLKDIARKSVGIRQ